MQQSLTSTPDSTQLQPQGSSSIQPGQASLQTQTSNSATTQSQATGQPQQDVLGIQDYKSFDSLTVQGAPISQQKPVTAGKVSGDVFIVVLVIFLVVAFVVLRRFLRRQPTVDTIAGESTKSLATESIVAIKTPVKKHNKKHSSGNKVVKKSKAKAKKKKK